MANSVHIEDVSPVEKKLTVEIPWDQVRAKLDRAYRELAKEAQIRGFRKGKVPRNVLERMYGKQLQQEVARELVQESFIAAAEEHKLEPVAEPVVEEAKLEPNQGFKYSARIEVRGPTEIGKWEGLEARRRKVSIPEEQVDKALEHKRMMHTEFKPIEGRTTSATSDVLILAVKGTVGEHKIDRPEISIDLGEPKSEPLPGMAAALVGIPLDAKDHEITLDIPADTEQKEIAGQKAVLQVTIKDAREKQVPALDDEFAKDTGEAETLAELRAKAREGLEKQARDAAEREARDAVLKALVRENQIPVAPALIERGIDNQIQRARYSLAMQGIDLMKSGIDLGGMRDRLRDGATEEIRGQLLLEEIADRHQLEVTEADVDAKVAELAQMQNKPANKLKAEMDKDGSLGSLRWRLRQEKALDLVVSRATITETDEPPPSAEGEAEAEEQTK